MRLPEIALGLQNEDSNWDEVSVDQARTWLTFCCMDLGRHINQNYFISEVTRYTELGKHLLYTPFCRNVDFRIDAYLEVLSIANNARKTFQFSNNFKSEPISVENLELLQESNHKLDSWYHRHSTAVDPVYQSYSKPQDRDRMKIPYNLIRMYTNGYVLHGLKPGVSAIHPLRVHFVGIAVDAGIKLLDCALQSMNYQSTLKYSIDYSDSSLGSAINYLLHACNVAFHYVNTNEIIQVLERAQKMFQNANLNSKAQELSNALGQLVQANAVSSEMNTSSHQDQAMNDHQMSDNPDWLSNFRLPLSDFSLDEVSLENIFLYSGE
ncbi:hypothetical protein N7532_002828 [Penicillium argentinense]|uniref:Uncharacterized protein n=1 Tax=Penicillium argentinense TaxID=1131581 RepID=A0A9W9G167_9EURO|nr:uncharacterized protein N7532_002828 [Penicillium argentinense]KAJ5110183.1 hypothetical protein N7532_002828 [Penicillium argentinense]